jgi:hypothetical protein
MNSTLGQPSPLMEQGMDPYSENYGLLPGFWYTLDAGSWCIYDYFGDGDVDGADLAEFMNAFLRVSWQLLHWSSGVWIAFLSERWSR